MPEVGPDSAGPAVYVLTKNEGANLAKCLESVLAVSTNVTVVDSGSTDCTLQTASRYRAKVLHHVYIDHSATYNWISNILTAADQWAVVLDADMELTRELWLELLKLMSVELYEAIKAPILMYHDGTPLKFGSLCPPKVMAFKGGSARTEGVGHGEALVPMTRVGKTIAPLVHNDLKPYSHYLLTQLRYANKFRERVEQKSMNWRDRIRSRTAILALVVPMVSFVLKMGFRDGRAGKLYAIDRAIAELLQHRQTLSRSD
jgi:glycosyltransferase involved in cell wall biosynthesis